MPFIEFVTVTLLVSAVVVLGVWIANRTLWHREQRRNILRRLKEHS